MHGAACTDCRSQRSRHRHRILDRGSCKCGKEQRGQHEAAASVLLAFHASPHACDHKGRTALHVATTRHGAALLLRWCAAHNAASARVSWPWPTAGVGKEVERVLVLRTQRAHQIPTPSAVDAIGSKSIWRTNATAALMARDRDHRTPLMTCVKHQYDLVSTCAEHRERQLPTTHVCQPPTHFHFRMQIAEVLLRPKLIPVDQVREALQLRATYLQHRQKYTQQQHGSAALALSDRIHGSGIDADRMDTEGGVCNSSKTMPSTNLEHMLTCYIDELDT